MAKKFKKQFTALAMIGVSVLPLVAPSVSALADDSSNTGVQPATGQDSSDTTTDNKGTVDPKTGLTTVVSVNGNKLVKDQAIKAGDTVTFDIVYLPGDRGLMSNFKDILPKGLKYDPSSPSALTAYAVNNDGTIGDEITKDGKITVNKKMIKWVPTNPINYFFVGSKGTQNRILFHITTKAEDNIPHSTTLANIATGDITNPKTNKTTTSSDTATVHTPGIPKTPTIKKSVIAQTPDGGDKQDTASQNTGDTGKSDNGSTDKSGDDSQTPSSSDLIAALNKEEGLSQKVDASAKFIAGDDQGKAGKNTPTTSIGTFKAQDGKSYEVFYDKSAKTFAVSDSDGKYVSDLATVLGVKATDGTDDSTDSDKDMTISTDDSDTDVIAKSQKLVDEADKIGVDSSELEGLIKSAPKTLTMDNKAQIVGAFKSLAGTYETAVKNQAKDAADAKKAAETPDTSDSINLKNHDDLYTYIMNVNLPAGSVKDSLDIDDHMENVQTVDSKNVHIYDASGKEITDQGKVSISKANSTQNDVKWTANPDYVHALAKANKDTSISMKITDVTLKGDNPNDEARYADGKQVKVPNVATLGYDGKTVDSNKTEVLPPLNPDATPGTKDNPVNPNNPQQAAQNGQSPINTGEMIKQNAWWILTVIAGVGLAAYATFRIRKQRKQG